jgi:hypothetical protein
MIPVTISPIDFPIIRRYSLKRYRTAPDKLELATPRPIARLAIPSFLL